MNNWFDKHFSWKGLKTTLLGAAIVTLCGFLWGKLSDDFVGRWLDKLFTDMWSLLTNAQSWMTNDVTFTRWQLLAATALLIIAYAVIASAYKALKSTRLGSTRLWLRALDTYIALVFARGRLSSFERGRIEIQFKPLFEPPLDEDAAEQEEVPAYQPSDRAGRVIEALASPHLLDNEASAQELATALQANVNAVHLALHELFESDYVLDAWHSNERWFRLSQTGQAYALERGFIEDLAP